MCRAREVPFDPARGFHAAIVGRRLCVKGAPEILVSRCTHIRLGRRDEPLDELKRQTLWNRLRQAAGQGLRILLVAQGPGHADPADPGGLTALGYVGIRDPLRASVRAAVRRCQEAGVRVIMLTGDDPATARAIASAAGLLRHDEDILTGGELAELQNGDLDQRLERTTVIARATPLDKYRIVEALQRLGHTVAMTGDGVNDAPSLRLADVGIAMGQGTEVARQAGDLVLGTDDFSTLVEAFVEGRGFWNNMRRALGLLLGGNLGELGLIVGANILGLGSPLNARQILVVNLITDALPALSVVLQQPEHRNLANLAREGTAALDETLHYDVWRRGLVTALPALTSYILARRLGSPQQASSVAFASIVINQLVQTLEAGRVEGRLSRSVLGAVAGSGAVLLAAFTVPGLPQVLNLAMPTALGWGLIEGGVAATLGLDRLWTRPDSRRAERSVAPRLAGSTNR